MKSLMQILKLLFFLTMAPCLLCGCQVIQSEIQESKIAAAGPTSTVDGTELRLESSLKRTFHSDGRKFDLQGKLAIISSNGSFPEKVGVYHMALKPGWKGWPGYFVINIKQHNGIWNMVNTGMNREYLTFSGVSKSQGDRIIIQFAWSDVGGLMGEKPEHFATYDVSVTLLDAQNNRHILTNPGVSTD